MKRTKSTIYKTVTTALTRGKHYHVYFVKIGDLSIELGAPDIGPLVIREQDRLVITCTPHKGYVEIEVIAERGKGR